MLSRWVCGACAFAALFLVLTCCLPTLAVEPSPAEEREEASLAQGIAKLGFLWPLMVEGRVASRFGQRVHPVTGKDSWHMGVDIAAPYGIPVRSAKAGSVVFAGRRGGYGEAVIIAHDESSSSLYGHCSRLYVKRGQRVYQGQIIAALGDTGVTTGPHLHFEIRGGGGAVDPLSFWNSHPGQSTGGEN
ncbi:MAG: Murein DD-endopeptidase MepM [Synergistetes bacterium ADurb.BinA166]|jgi:murein DD-endopeptidase MepM/ murein hydrolase activator NlpD|nr:MAG: Murein DD-endopeptidase MepM [Synergistetes bacterium ADurb.BinA166]